jgi:hypothetical protein
MARKSWRQKFDNGRKAEVVVLERPFAGLMPGRRLLITTPAEIDTWIRTIPAGRTATVDELRRDLARRHGADATCPMTTGIFLRIVAECANEQAASGAADVTPFWRVIEPRSPLARKLSFDTTPWWERRKAELAGH